jgi:fatty acid desaturase
VSDLIGGLVRLLLQAALLVMGLVVAVSLLLAFAVLAVVFGLRLLWARVTGRPFVLRFGSMGVDPAASWRRYQGWQQRTARRTPQPPGTPAASRTPGAITQDIEDVEPKDPRAG